MRKILNHAVMTDFGDELEKIAGLAEFVAKNKGALGTAGAFLGHGAAIGAGIGGLHGAYKGYEDARDQGAGVGGALGMGALSGLGGAASGGTRGALIGAGVGGALGTLRPGAADSVRKALSSTESRFGALGRFGQRQMHGLTGLKPEEGLSSDAIRGGSWGTERAANAAAGTPRFDKANDLHKLQKKVTEGDLDNLPGIVGALRGDKRLEAMKTLGKHNWKNADTFTRLSVGGAALGIGAAAAMPEQEGGPGKGESIGRSVGGLAGGVVGSALPLFPGQLAMQAGSGAGTRVGKAVDWLRGRRNGHSPSELANHVTGEGQHAPTETNYGAGAGGVSQ